MTFLKNIRVHCGSVLALACSAPAGAGPSTEGSSPRGGDNIPAAVPQNVAATPDTTVQSSSNASGNFLTEDVPVEDVDDSFDSQRRDACAAEALGSERIPVDLYFMVDTTGSMNCAVPEETDTPCTSPRPPYSSNTRWLVERNALNTFIDSPKNEGMGVGMGFFPSSPLTDICDPQNYVAPAVEIADLPQVSTDLNAAIATRIPLGYTPTVPSLTGALQHVTGWADKHPSRKVALVYSTDGYPLGCEEDNTVEKAAEIVGEALSSHGIKTFVLGIGPNLAGLNQIAQAGGTDKAYLINTGGGAGSMDAAEQLTNALQAIRTSATLGCSFRIPEPPEGKNLDYNKVNVRYTNDAGKVTEVPRDPSRSECNQGWQYSADKSQVNLCGEMCETIKTELSSTVEILLGCATVVSKVK